MKKLISIFVLVQVFFMAAGQQERSEKLQKLESSKNTMQSGKPTATLKSAARLFKTRDDLTSVILIIPAGSKVTVLDSDSLWYKVDYDENEGFILKRQATIDKETAAAPMKDSISENVQDNNAAARNDAAPEDRFMYLEGKYGKNMAVRINSGKIWKGMSADMVKDSWGSPWKINRIINGNTINEDWTYKTTKLFFRDNTLVDWGPAKN